MKIILFLAALAAAAVSLAADNELPAELNMARIKEDAAIQRPLLVKLIRERIASETHFAEQVRTASIDGSMSEDHEARNGKFIVRTKEIRELVAKNAAEQLREAKKMAAEVEAGKRIPIPFLMRPLNSGMVGRIESRPKVFQVIDADNMLAEVKLRNPDNGDGKTELLWISGIETSSLSDGATVGLDLDNSIFEVGGGRTYANALGTSRTVTEIDRLRANQLEVLREKLKVTMKK
jgi:hypothetical protein